MSKHPHDAMIRAWLDGKQIQCNYRNHGVWRDVCKVSAIEWIPFFSHYNSYRIKPAAPDEMGGG